ncbi:MAG: hypothetical protein JNM17_05495 [Archangium sp.]|nr:hypothetical protein [Archangium sp.]
MRRRGYIYMYVLLASAGCDYGFRPETLVENLRLIGINASPANVRPGESTQLTALILDPSRSMPSTVLWIGCEADPYNLNRSPCANPDVLTDSASLTGGTGTLPPGVSIIGFGPRATYSVPATLFDPLETNDPRRMSGTVGTVLAFAVAETVSPAAPPEELQALFERVQRKEVRSVLAIFRIQISESMVRNANPTVDSLVVGGEVWPRGARMLVREKEPVTLDLVAPDSSFEAYEVSTPEGIEQRTERILVAWYSTAGRFSEERTALREGVQTIFTAPGAGDEKDPVPEKRTGSLYTVLRDTRGAQAWKEWPFFVCDDAAPAPSVTSVDWPSDVMTPLVLHGTQLDSLVDVIVEGAALERPSFDSASGTFSGFLPSGVGVMPQSLTLHARNCAREIRGP